MQEICLNIGCGLSRGDSWMNVDTSPSLLLSKIPTVGRPLARQLKAPDWPTEVKYGNVLCENLLPEASCRLIFASHVLEHMSMIDARKALNNLHRFLMPGGIFRIIVPDLEACVKRYIERCAQNDATAAEMFLEETGIGLKESRATIFARLRAAFANSRHQWMYDRYSLERILKETGFTAITPSEFGNWSDPRFGEIEDPQQQVFTVCFEATKIC